MAEHLAGLGERERSVYSAPNRKVFPTLRWSPSHLPIGAVCLGGTQSTLNDEAPHDSYAPWPAAAGCKIALCIPLHQPDSQRLKSTLKLVVFRRVALINAKQIESQVVTLEQCPVLDVIP